MDRLPWLADEPARQSAPVRRRSWDLTGWAIAAMMMIAGFSFWLGSLRPAGEATRSAGVNRVASSPVAPQSTPNQPQVRIAPQPEVAPTTQPNVREMPIPQVRIAPPPRRATPHEAAKPPSKPGAEALSTTEPAVAPSSLKPGLAVPLKPWPSRVVAGASGRLVQIGAYGSRIQAKRGWLAMARAYPALNHLPAVVVVTRNSRQRFFYRFQIGTTSQAHSEVLCQRMEKIRLSCAVVGLPWKAKVER
jgi:hypothetical protein